jgi:hypothetical protein
MKRARPAERIMIAKALKKNSASVDVIAKSTGLTKNQTENF